VESGEWTTTTCWPWPMSSRCARFESGSVRDWIGGQTVVLHRPSGPVFAEPSAVMFDALKWMPRQRRAAVLKNVLHMEEEEL
jgi:hypothetical protein